MTSPLLRDLEVIFLRVHMNHKSITLMRGMYYKILDDRCVALRLDKDTPPEIIFDAIEDTGHREEADLLRQCWQLLQNNT